MLAARPKFTGIYVGNGLRFAEIRLSRLEKHTHTHTLDTHARLPTSESGCGRPARELRVGEESRASGLGGRRPAKLDSWPGEEDHSSR
jgi:hypothetical protein